MICIVVYILVRKFFCRFVCFNKSSCGKKKIIRKLQLTFPKNIMLSIYNSLILPYINYSILSWGYDSIKYSCCKKANRAINSAGYNAHTEPLFKLYNLLKLEDIYKFRLLIFLL